MKIDRRRVYIGNLMKKCGNNIKQFEKDNKKIKEAVVKTKKKSVKNLNMLEIICQNLNEKNIPR